MEDLGGARVHAETTGNAHFYALSEQECFDQVKRLVSFIPWNNQERAKVVEPKEPSAMLNIEQVVPADPKQPYDVRDVIRCIVDDSDFLEIQELWAANIVIGFGRMAGETVGFVANQPMVLAGCASCTSATSAASSVCSVLSEFSHAVVSSAVSSVTACSSSVASLVTDTSVGVISAATADNGVPMIITAVRPSASTFVSLFFISFPFLPKKAVSKIS